MPAKIKREYTQYRIVGTRAKGEFMGERWYGAVHDFDGDMGKVMARVATLSKNNTAVKAEFRTVRETVWRDTIEEV